MRVCQLGLFHSGSVHFLLIATAIQGLTPDAHDLSSLNALRVICPALAGSNTEPQDDGLPDEVCAPATIETKQASHPNAASNDRVTFARAANEYAGITANSSAYRSRKDGSDMKRTDDLLHCLCRLNC